MVASVFGNGISYLFSIELARLLGPGDFGVYALGLTLFNVLVLLTSQSVGTAGIRYVSQALGLDQVHQVRRTILATLLLTVAGSCISASSLLLLSKRVALSVYAQPELAPVLTMFALAIPLAATSYVLVSILQAFQSLKYAVIVRYLWEPVGKTCLGLSLFMLGFGLEGVVTGIVITFVIAVLIGGQALRRQWKLLPQASNELTIIDVVKITRFCGPLLVSNIFGVIAPRSDILILGYWASSYETGVYQSALQTAGVIALVLGAFETALAPSIARVLAQKHLGRLCDLYQSGARLVFALTIPLFVLISLFAKDILGMFGSGFSVGSACLIVLSLGHLVNSAASSPNHVLLMDGRSRIVMANTIIVGVVQVAAISVLAPFWGMIGVAIATASGLVTLAALRIVQVWRIYRIHPFTWNLLKPLCCGGLTVTVVSLMRVQFVETPIAVLALLSMTLYIGLLVIGGVASSDRAILQSVAQRLGVLRVFNGILEFTKHP